MMFVVVVTENRSHIILSSSPPFFCVFFFVAVAIFLVVYDLSHLINKNVCAFSVSLRHNTPTLRHIPVGVC